MTKQCSKCKEIKNLNEFAKRKDSKDGHRGQCKICKYYINAHTHSINREKKNKNSSEYYYKNKERALVRQKILNKKHREENPNYNKEYYQKNRTDILIQKSIYLQENLSIIIAKNVKRYTTKKNRTPKWLTKAQLLEIKEIYIEAARLTKETGISHHVDHIVPLQGKEVSGLHVPWNLQILTAKENISKGNKLLPLQS